MRYGSPAQGPRTSLACLLSFALLLTNIAPAAFAAGGTNVAGGGPQ